MRGISAENERDLILSVGTQKTDRPLSPIEVAGLIERAIRSGTTIGEISKEILLDTTMITRFRRLSALAPEIQHFIGWGGKSRISFSAASEIARLRTPEEQEYVGTAAVEHGLSKKEVIQVVEARNKLGKSIDESVKEILDMRPRTIKRYLYIGAIRSSRVKERLNNMSQKERDELFEKVVTSNLPNLPPWDGLLGKERFTLVGEEDLNRRLVELKADFASSINNYLESYLLHNE